MAAQEAGFEDLTARARIRQAALAQFTEHGFDRATVRGIAAAAGVSPGLLRHHFGSKQELRDAVDAHVMQEIRRVSDEIMAGAPRGDLSSPAISRQAIRPFQGYLARALMDGSPTLATLFDAIVGPSEEWLAFIDGNRADPPYTDRRTRAAVLTAMGLGLPLLHEHLSRVLGVDTYSDDGDRQVALALLDLYSHALMTPEQADSARAGLMGAPYRPPSDNR